MPPLPRDMSLWGLIGRRRDLSECFLRGADRSIALGDLADGSSLGAPLEEFAGRAVLVATADQFTAALAAIELDGIARRLLLCPPDASAGHMPHIVATGGIDIVVSDGSIDCAALPDNVRLIGCRPDIARSTAPDRAARCRTEWILLTSGTTGVPKLVVHTLASLVGAIAPAAVAPATPSVWSTFYDIRRYGGMQIFFRGMLGGNALVLSNPRESTADFLARAGRYGVTHISGTPSHWRRALMSPAAGRIAPRYVRLSGEIADQAILDDLRAFYNGAGVAHAFASTEAGVAFDVNDGLAGFPAELLDRRDAAVEMTVEDGSLRIRSARTATRYLGADATLRGKDGFVDTGDMIERRGGRCYFAGRRGGIINVGGLKVHPEEVEAVINRHPAVQMSLVKARKNPFTGAVVVADVVVRADPAAAFAPAPALQQDILAACRGKLPPHKVPASIRFVPALTVGAAGKLARPGA